MIPLKSTLLILTLCAVAAGVAPAQENSVLVRILVRKGILTEQEAAEVLADLTKESAGTTTSSPAVMAGAATVNPAAGASPVATVNPAGTIKTAALDPTAATVSTAKGNFLEKVTLSGRIQTQYVGLATDIDGPTADPASVNHWFLRRVRLGVRAQLTDGISSYVNYDMAGTFFDAADVTWKLSDTLAFDFGLRKAPIGFEEFLTSSGAIKAIERSGVTRYFMEVNNGRRLGAGKYREGIFLVGGNAREGFSYQLAVTNPEGIASAGEASVPGNSSNNDFAYWAHGAYSGILDDGSYKVGASVGFMPGQGGQVPALTGPRQDMSVVNLFGDVTIKGLNVTAEYFQSTVENGSGGGFDVQPWGYYVQPSYRSGPYEAVFRYGYVDSDGRGINLSDSVRSAPSGGTMDKLTEMYAGGTWYLRGNDAKFSLGYVWGQSNDTVTGAPAKATTDGVRTQFQVGF